MANNHQHGAFGYLEMLEADGTTWYNLTPHVNGFNAPRSVDTAEDTSLQPTGDAKTFLQGLRTGTVDFTVMVPTDGAPLLKIKAILNKAARDGTTIREFPFGKTTGTYAESQQILFTNPGSVTLSNTGAVTAPVACQMNGPITQGVWDGSAIS